MENKTIASAVCPQCGGPLKEADDKGNMVCEYCGAVALDTRHSFVHTVRDFDAELPHLIENAEGLIASGAYDMALDQYRVIAARHSADYRGWWGLARAKSCDFSKTEISSYDYKELCRNCETAISKAPDDKKAELEAAYKGYLDLIEKERRRQDRMEKSAERSERLIAFSFPIAVVLYTIFTFVYIMIYTKMNSPEHGGTGGGGLIGMLIPALVFGVLYGIWAIVQDSEYAIIGIYFSTVLSVADYVAVMLIFGESINIPTIVVGLVVYAIAFLPGYLLTRKARGY